MSKIINALSSGRCSARPPPPTHAVRGTESNVQPHRKLHERREGIISHSIQEFVFGYVVLQISFLVFCPSGTDTSSKIIHKVFQWFESTALFETNYMVIVITKKTKSFVCFPWKLKELASVTIDFPHGFPFDSASGILIGCKSQLGHFELTLQHDFENYNLAFTKVESCF